MRLFNPSQNRFSLQSLESVLGLFFSPLSGFSSLQGLFYNISLSGPQQVPGRILYDCLFASYEGSDKAFQDPIYIHVAEAPQLTIAHKPAL